MSEKTRRLFMAGAVGLFAASAAGLGLRGTGAGPRDGSRLRERPEVIEHAPYDPELADRTVAFWESLAGRDPEGALAFRELAGAYLRRQRENGDPADAVRAEEAARASLRVLPRNNIGALTRLARSLMAQHRFPEALDAARMAAALDPRAARLVAEARIELGDYDAAETILSASTAASDDLNDYAVRARLEAVDGRPEVALRLLREAAHAAERRSDMPAELVAWHHAMVGHALVDAGQIDEAEAACRAALKVFPRDHRAMTTTAVIAAWRGDWRSALARAEEAINVSPRNPEALRLVGDARRALGRDADAERSYARLKDLSHSFPKIYDRHWALFCADLGRDLDEALSLARDDLGLRHDVHAHDTLAWVYFQKGMLAEAESSMKLALARGTQEAPLFYHAGMIARARGDLPRARDFFTRARAINPHSVPSRWVRWLESQAGGVEVSGAPGR